MTIPRSLSIPFILTASLAAAGCDRGAATRGADAAPSTGSTVQAAPATPSASTPMPVSPSGTTNTSTAAQGSDLSNSTRATGNSNVYQPPSGDNAAPGSTAPGSAASSATSSASAPAAAPAASSNAQSTSSQTLGTSPPPNDGTLPSGTTGSTNTRRGSGKRL